MIACPTGSFEVLSFWQLLMNPWGLLQYAHNMTGAVVTGSFVMAPWAPFICWKGDRKLRPHLPQSRRHRRRRLFDPHHLSHRRPARQVRCAQSTGRHRRHGRPLQDRGRRGPVLMGQPNEETGQIDNPHRGQRYA
jgi:cytochrome d ubiquinol oxidase subunit I